ncbi:hypothetical protein HmCmsJML044_01233 [Escherichia coli]|nr:hypothetical protein HmCmsJML044_01233 [Escherichia coli]
MPRQPIPSELKEKEMIWLGFAYCSSHRQIHTVYGSQFTLTNSGGRESLTRM